MRFTLASSLVAVNAAIVNAAYSNSTSTSSGAPLTPISFVPFEDNGKFGFLLSVPGAYSPFDGEVGHSDISFSDSYVDLNDAPAPAADFSLSSSAFGYDAALNTSDIVDVALLGDIPGPGTYAATVFVAVPTAPAKRRVKRAESTYTLSATLTVTPSATTVSTISTGSFSTATFTITCTEEKCADVTITTTVPCDASTVTYTTTTCSDGACSAVETSGIATEIYTVTEGEIVTIYTTIPCDTASTTAAVSTYEGAAFKVGANGVALGAFIAGLLLI